MIALISTARVLSCATITVGSFASSVVMNAPHVRNACRVYGAKHLWLVHIFRVFRVVNAQHPSPPFVYRAHSTLLLPRRFEPAARGWRRSPRSR